LTEIRHFGAAGCKIGKAGGMWREETDIMVAAIRAHPNIVSAVRQFTTGYLAWRRQLGVLNRVLATLGREHLLEHVMYLHFARQDRAGEHGATFERLAALSAARDRVGARATRSTHRLAQTAGLVMTRRNPTDRRLRVYEPTEFLLQLARESYSLAFDIFHELAPNLNLGLRLGTEREYLFVLVARLGRPYLEAQFAPRPKTDVFNEVVRLEGGRAILATVVECHWRGDDLPTSQEIAKRYYVSPSQTRAVLKTAESHGLITLAGRGRLVAAEPLAQAYLGATSRYLALYARSAFALDPSIFAPEPAAR
jgi:hypothetical protein